MDIPQEIKLVIIGSITILLAGIGMLILAYQKNKIILFLKRLVVAEPGYKLFSHDHEN